MRNNISDNSDNPSDIPVISKEYYENLKDFSDNFLSFISKLQKNNGFTDLLIKQGVDDTVGFIGGGFALDLIKWFSLVADINNLKSKEAFGLLYLIFGKYAKSLNDFENVNLVYHPSMLKMYEPIINNFKKNLEYGDAKSVLVSLLGNYNEDLKTEYLKNLYRFASIIVKSNGTVTKKEEEALEKIMNINEYKQIQQLSNQEQSLDKSAVSIQSSGQTLEELLEELNSLIGLNAVKQEINSLVNFISVQKARESSGLKSSSNSYHIVFTGNPGTGKTTVARIVSEIYRNLGVLTQGQLIETDRSGLVAEYLGQTAVKVNKIVDSALNGTLFIDEAYSLIGENKDDFGKEAVSTLLKRMEDNRDKLVVILAGYTNEMKDFIDINPGFKSRFNRYIEFADYSPDELLAIFKSMCKKHEYTIEDDVENKLTQLFSTAFASRDKTFGNGRYVRNIFEKTLEKQANRIAGIQNLTKETLTSLSIDDIM